VGFRGGVVAGLVTYLTTAETYTCRLTRGPLRGLKKFMRTHTADVRLPAAEPAP